MKNIPDFILVGTAKAGTSFLLKYLRQHSDIYLPNSNELYFHSKLRDFKGPYDKAALKKQTSSFEEYISSFDGHSKEKIIGEFATDYLYSYEQSIKSIKKTVGADVKIVIILRNPVDRTFSHYKHVVSKFQEPLSFWNAIDSQEKRKKDKWRWVYQYAKISEYYNQVKAYKEAFKNVHVIIYEDLRDKPIETIDKLYEFLDLEKKHFKNIDEKVNVKRVQKSKLIHKLISPLNKIERKILGKTFLAKRLSQINEKKLFLSYEDKIKLYDYFKNDIAKLEGLLNIDLNVWKKYDK